MFSRHPDFRAPDAQSEARITAIIAQMTLEEKIACLAGSQNKEAHNGDTVPCTRVGIPSFRMADASVGVHWWSKESTTFPATVALAASFDPELALRYGQAIGRECRARGIHILLGPGVNIYRSALCGRNFEYLGEDPFLAAAMVTGYIRGLQDQGVAATVKHYALNFQEYERHRVSSDVDERTLREIYLPAFEAAIREAGSGAVMTAYNRVNGAWCAEHRFLLKDILKGEWAFDGLVMSDWVSTYDTINSANNGLDLEMPRAKWFTPERLIPLVNNGVVPEAVLDDKIRRLLRLAIAFGWLDRPQQDSSIPLHDQTSANLAQEIAQESMVLLKNDGILPVDPNTVRRIAVIGPNAHPAVECGGGSAQNTSWRSVSILDGLKARFPDCEITAVSGVDPWRARISFKESVFQTPDGQPGIQADYYDNQTLSGKPFLSRVEPRPDARLTAAEVPPGLTPGRCSVSYQGTFTTTVPGEHGIRTEVWNGGVRIEIDGICVIDSWLDEVMGDREVIMDLAPGIHTVHIDFHGMRERAFLQMGYEHVDAMRTGFPEALAAAKAADLVVFCGGNAKQCEGEARDRFFAMPSEIQRLLVAVAQANPRTVAVLNAGGNLDMEPWHDLVAGILWAWYPGQEGGTAVARILAGDVNPSGRLPATFERKVEDRSSATCYHDEDRDLRVGLADGVFGGYRHFDRLEGRKAPRPRYPFGYGLSYTTFAFENLRISDGKTLPVVVECDVVNTGSRAGKAVVQVFVGEKKPSLPRPVKELKGVCKVTLQAGERRSVRLELPWRAFAFFDPIASRWTVNPGSYRIQICSDAQTVHCTGLVRLSPRSAKARSSRLLVQ
jgi:beta-glucosidase